MDERRGMIHVYTGNGKGKTTASLGLALRAVGHGYSVYIIQFMKGGSYTGEMISSTSYLKNNVNFVQYGKGCVRESKQLKLNGFQCPRGNWVKDDTGCGECRYCFINDDTQSQFVVDAFAHAKKVVESGDYDIVVLDELNCAVNAGIVPVEEVVELMEKKAIKTELILTGRNAHQKIIDAADLVTEMKEIKHYYSKGVSARKGIEY